MFFLILLLLLFWFQLRGAHLPGHQLLFMACIFAGLAYVCGFLDSRLFGRLDKARQNHLQEVESRYESTHHPSQSVDVSTPL